MKQKQAWTLYKKEEETAIEELCSGYRRFLDAGKTERECIKEAVRLAKKKGYRNAGRSNRETKYMRCTAPRPRYFFR